MSLDSIKRRREERLRRLREEMSQRTFELDDEDELSFEPRSVARSSSNKRIKQDTWEDDFWEEKEQPEDTGSGSFVLKTVISLFLLSFTYLIYHSEIPFSKQGQQFIGQVMSREFNFKGVVAQVENRFGITPSILPTFGATSSQAVWNSDTKSEGFLSPIKGEITASFETDGKGIVITSQDQGVKAIEEGWVIFVGHKEAMGNTIHILHKNGTKSLYSGIEDAQVSEGDWVQPGQIIAHMSPGSSLYFSMQIKEHYVDPTSVITFE